LAWIHVTGATAAFRACPMPDLIRYVEDRDLWRFALPDSEAVSAAIASYDQTFEEWDRLAAAPIDDLAREGRAILRYQLRLVDRAVANAYPATIAGQRVLAV